MAKRSRNVALAALRVSGQVLYERVARPMARDLVDVPCSPFAITPEWLTATVCSKTPGAAVVDVKVKTVSSGTQSRHRLYLRYNTAGEQAGLPPTIFTKSLSNIFTRIFVGFNGHARTEGNFYSQIRPLVAIEAPLCYYSCYDRNTYAAIHLLEDLVATKQATFCNNTTSVSRAMAEDQMDLLGSLHGRFYDDQTMPEQYRWLIDYPRWFGVGVEKMHTEYYTQKALDAAAPQMPEKLLARRQDIWPATMRALAVHRSEPWTFIHSDVHIGNWYRTGAGRMGLCDWQCPSRGHWSRDVAYAITTALTPEDRRAWERDLLTRYLDKFAEHSGTRIDFDRAWTWYRQQILHAFAMWTITLCHSPLLPSMQPEAMTLAMLDRIATAIADLDVLDAA